MDLRFTDEQEMMRKMVRDFAQKKLHQELNRWKMKNSQQKLSNGWENSA